MTPSTDERIASVIRSLTEVILPHLPADASLAQEQCQLAIGHLQILRLQIDGIQDFEAEELADTRVLAWSQVLIQDVAFILHSVKNDGSRDLSTVGVTLWLADLVGGDADASDDRPFFDLLLDTAFLTDADGKRYVYKVFREYVVEPTQVSVTRPLEGRNIVTLQTCTLPDYSRRLIVQAEKVA